MNNMEHGSQNQASTDGTLAPVSSGTLANQEHQPRLMTVRMLEDAMLSLFPSEDAEAWDRTGLVVGDPREGVTGVAVALDPTVQTVERARELGCNVLATHHPPFIDPPDSFAPQGSGSCGPQLTVWQAIKADVCLMCFHTALDVNPAAQKVLPSMLGLDFKGVLVPLRHDAAKGYGQICAMAEDDQSLTLEHMAARCVSVFGRMPRVWGSPSLRIRKAVTATGSGGGLVQPCLDAAVDCLICGEVHYHDALHASEAGLAIIELGHDVSELPLCAVLARALAASGVDQSLIRPIDQLGNWWTPEATRR